MMTTTTIQDETYTEKEMIVLKAFWDTSMDCCGACNEYENMSYANARDLAEMTGMSEKAIGGVMASLDSKCAISDTMDSARGANINDWVINDIEAEYFNKKYL